MDMEQKRSYGPIIGIVIIFVLFVLGALYFWGKSLSERDRVAVPPVSPSDDISSIESDLRATSSVDLSEFDSI